MNEKYGFAPAVVKGEGMSIDPEDFGLPKGYKPPERKLDAYKDLMKFLNKNEIVEGIVFGEYGWGGYGENECKNPIPKEMKGVVLTLERAKPLMNGWSFNCGHGSPECYATYIWTNQRVIWVTQYDGATTLDSAPRSPKNCIPEMPGG